MQLPGSGERANRRERRTRRLKAVFLMRAASEQEHVTRAGDAGSSGAGGCLHGSLLAAAVVRND